MEKTIKISKEIWQRLNSLKYKLGLSSLDSTIAILFRLLNKFKLMPELETLAGDKR